MQASSVRPSYLPMLHVCQRCLPHQYERGHQSDRGFLIQTFMTSLCIFQACLSETMDMIGLFGFRHSFNAIR